jgi:hypothetical protein
MTRRAVIAVGLALTLFFAGAGVAVWAQGRLPTELTTSSRTDGDRYKVPSPDVAVFSGNNVGIRVTGPKDASGRVPGKFVVKIDGQWVDVVAPPTVTPAVR